MIDTYDDRLLAAAKQFLEDEFGATFYTKPTPLMWLFSIFLFAASFGMIRDFMTRFTTTVGPRVYLPSKEQHPFTQAVALFHEAAHMRRQQLDGETRYTFGYAFVRRIRARYEMEACQMSNAVVLWRGGYLAHPSREQIDLFTGHSYLWMDTDRERVRIHLQQGITEIKSGAYEMRVPLAATIKAIVKNAVPEPSKTARELLEARRENG